MQTRATNRTQSVYIVRYANAVGAHVLTDSTASQSGDGSTNGLVECTQERILGNKNHDFM